MSQESPGSELSIEPSTATLELASLNAKVDSLLPSQYQTCFDAVNPRSMGSAGLKYGSDSRVAWDQIWTHFCDLALAGGPPHRGTLLEAPTPQEVEHEPAGYQLVCEEIIRGIRMTSGMAATPSPELGWLTVHCSSKGMAMWLVRAVMAENVFARQKEQEIQVPVGPNYRLAKEVKNVVVAIAKTCHYWQDHFTSDQRLKAGALFSKPSTPSLLKPPSRPQVLERVDEYREVAEILGHKLKEHLGLPLVKSASLGWVGLNCHDEKMAAWFVRSAIAENILARREEQILFLPVPEPNLVTELSFEVLSRLVRLHHIWTTKTNAESR